MGGIHLNRRITWPESLFSSTITIAKLNAFLCRTARSIIYSMHSEETLKFKLNSYFLPNFYFVGIIGIIGGIGLILTSAHLLLGILIILFSFPLVFTRKGVSIDLSSNTITEFKEIVGIEIGDGEKYNELMELRLVREKVSQAMHSRGSSSTLKYIQHTMFLITDSKSYFLGSSKDQEKMVLKIEILADRLNIPAKYDIG